MPRSSLAERAEAFQQARRYMAEIFALAKVKRAIRHKAPPATDRSYQPGDGVRVWSEKQVESRIGE